MFPLTAVGQAAQHEFASCFEESANSLLAALFGAVQDGLKFRRGAKRHKPGIKLHRRSAAVALIDGLAERFQSASRLSQADENARPIIQAFRIAELFREEVLQGLEAFPSFSLQHRSLSNG